MDRAGKITDRDPVKFTSLAMGATLVLLTGCRDGCRPAFTGDEGTDGASTEHALSIALTPMWNGMTFAKPVLLTHAPGEPEFVYVVEQAGRIWRLNIEGSGRGPERTLMLDLRSRISTRGGEEGLLGLTFHPNYAVDGRAFVHYSSASEKAGVISSFARVDGRLDPDSEREIMRQTQPWRNHNGGMIEFGPDGMLYVSWGDGGSAGDPKQAGQDLGTWLGSILRIDVDCQAETYCVPSDNPFVGQAGARPEIFAYGLRNVWRFSFDPVSRRMWAADVGQDEFEEVNLITAGGNYGWRAYEAFAEFRGSLEPDSARHIEPVASYTHADGQSVTGGYVYRGRRHPSLQGTYVFADYESGKIWGLVPGDGERGGWQRLELLDSRRRIASFGVDAAGNMYVCDHDGEILAIDVVDEDELEAQRSWPENLDELGLFSELDGFAPAPGYEPYEVNSPLWSDGAAKQRWLFVPEGSRVDYVSRDSWAFPPGSVVVKNFTAPGDATRVLETRVIRKEPEYWQAMSYVWNEAGTRAVRAPEGASIELEGADGPWTWQVPSASDCRDCHTRAAGFVLGLSGPQLDRQTSSGDSHQLENFAGIGWLEGFDLDAQGRHALVDPADDTQDFEARARAYLHANCAHCHQPGATSTTNLDLRWYSPLEPLLGAEATQGDMGVAGAALIVAGDPDKSILWRRMVTRELGGMPPLASVHVDDRGSAIIEAWIAGLE